MALKGILPPIKPKKTPVEQFIDYVGFLDKYESGLAVPGSMKPKTSKPVVSFTQTAKSVKGVPVPGTGTGETKIENPGVFTSKSGYSITVEGGRTLNLGNFESAKIAVTLTVPCEPDTLEEAYAWATEWVSGKIDVAINEAKGS